MTFQVGNWMFDFWEQWSPFIDKYTYNWKKVDWLKIYTEDDKRFGNFEFEIGMLGVGVRIVYTYNNTKNKREIKRLMDKFK